MIEYKSKYEDVWAENLNLKDKIKSLHSITEQKEHDLIKFEVNLYLINIIKEREKDLRNDVSDLKEKVDSISQNQSSLNNNSWSSDNAIQMFHNRLKQLEQEKSNISEDEKEVLKTPNTTKPAEQKQHTKKLKNALRVYKSRSRDFEKRW